MTWNPVSSSPPLQPEPPHPLEIRKAGKLAHVNTGPGKPNTPGGGSRARRPRIRPSYCAAIGRYERRAA